MAEAHKMESLLIKVPGGTTVVMDTVVSERELWACDVLAVVEERTGIPISALLLKRANGKLLDEGVPLPSCQVTFEAALVGGLAGGKGGFGAMLRALAKQNTGHKTTDFGACRDLNGRRLRHVNNELKLAKWQDAQDRKSELAAEGVEVDSDEEERAMATASGIKGWHLGVPSWIDHVKQRETKGQRRKLASKRRWEDEEADVLEAGLVVREVHGVVTMVDTLRGAFCVVDKDVYVPFTANTTDEDWSSVLRVGDDMMVKAVAKPQGHNKWYGFRAARLSPVPPPAADKDTSAQPTSAPRTTATASRSVDETASEAMQAAVLAGLRNEQSSKKRAKREVNEEGGEKKMTDELAPSSAVVAHAVVNEESSWLEVLAGEVEILSGGCLRGLGESFGSVGVKCALESGAWYYEIGVQTGGVMQVGWAQRGFKPDATTGDGVGDDQHSWAYDGARAQKWHGGTSEAYGSAWESGDVLGCSLDLTKGDGEISFALNGTPLGPAFSQLTSDGGHSAARASSSSSSTSSSSSSSKPAFFPAAALEGGEALTVCVGPSGLKYGPPPGYAAIGEALTQSSPANISAALAAMAQDSSEISHADIMAAAKAAVAKKAAAAASAATTPVAEVAKPASTPAKTPLQQQVAPQALDLSKYDDVASLEALGLDRLKAALMALGAKVGGTLQQRAERLMAFKNLKPGQAPDSALLAAPSAKKTMP